MKIKMEFDLSSDEAKDLFVPGQNQIEFYNKWFLAYTKAVNESMNKNFNFMNYYQKDSNES